VLDGHTVDLLALEAALAALDGISDAVLFKNPKSGAADELFAFVVIEEGYNLAQLKALTRSLCRQKIGAWAAPRVVQVIARVPRLADGLPDRTACGRLILELAAERSHAEGTPG
jgi:acyl-coenzyme A synthetase/AMP-(fatty) acid ligase